MSSEPGDRAEARAPLSRLTAGLLGFVFGPGSAHLLLGLPARGLVFLVPTFAAAFAGCMLFLSSPRVGTALLLVPVAAQLLSTVDVITLRKERFRAPRAGLFGVYLAGLIAFPIAVAIGLRMFVVEAVKMPSGSMWPTFAVGDHVFVDKGRAGKDAAKRGSLIVFPYPANPQQRFVKRIIGLPGDRIEVRPPSLFINGFEVPSCSLGRVDIDGQSAFVQVEFLEGAAYLVAYTSVGPGARAGFGTNEWTVADGEVFVLGDNRDNSHDSRAWREGRGGGVPIPTIGGTVSHRFLRGSSFELSPVDDLALPKGAERLESTLAECLAHRPDASASTPPVRR